MKCSYCGAQINKRDSVCIECGRKINNVHNDLIEKRTMILTKITCLILPLLGFILSIIFSSSDSLKSKVCLRWSFIGILFYIALFILFLLFWVFIIVNVLG
ncbi:MAG: hypothetical protein JEZ05_01090 [Tenericutes bacterium]|nr:hypothetical protein [Mycoplasmatota bacterium]